MPIEVKVISAHLTHNTETVSNMDPYCLINVGNEYRKTTTKDEAGFNPVWNQVVFFLNYDGNMRLQVFDKDLLTDDKVGEVTIDISSIYSKPGVPFKYSLELKYKSQKAGTLAVQITYLQGTNVQMTPLVIPMGYFPPKL